MGVEVEGGVLVGEGIVVREWGLGGSREVFLHHASSTVIYYYRTVIESPRLSIPLQIKGL